MRARNHSTRFGFLMTMTDEKYVPFDASTANADSHGPIPAKRSLKKEVTQSVSKSSVCARDDKKPLSVAIGITRAQIHFTPKSEYKTAAKCSNVDVKSSIPNQALDSSSRFKRAHQGSTSDIKKKKFTTLQAQAEGIQVMNQGNVMFQDALGKLVLAVNSNTQELVTANHNLETLANHAGESKSTLKDMSEQLTYFIANNRNPESLDQSADPKRQFNEVSDQFSQDSQYDEQGGSEVNRLNHFMYNQVDYDAIEQVTEEQPQVTDTYYDKFTERADGDTSEVGENDGFEEERRESANDSE